MSVVCHMYDIPKEHNVAGQLQFKKSRSLFMHRSRARNASKENRPSLAPRPLSSLRFQGLIELSHLSFTCCILNPYPALQEKTCSFKVTIPLPSLARSLAHSFVRSFVRTREVTPAWERIEREKFDS
jgi:hypothetical protein